METSTKIKHRYNSLLKVIESRVNKEMNKIVKATFQEETDNVMLSDACREKRRLLNLSDYLHERAIKEEGE